MVAEADRGWLPVFGATAIVTLPFPLPLAPAVIVSHADCSPADHAQPAGAVTVNVAAPPPGGIDRLAGDTPYVHVP